LRILRKELETLGARSRDLSPCYLDIGYWMLKFFERWGALGGARFQRASLRVPRKELKDPERDLLLNLSQSAAWPWEKPGGATPPARSAAGRVSHDFGALQDEFSHEATKPRRNIANHPSIHGSCSLS